MGIEEPSELAVKRAINAADRAGTPDFRPARGRYIAALFAAHSPVLGIQRSVCLRELVDEMRTAAGRDGAHGSFPALSDAADWIEERYG